MDAVPSEQLNPSEGLQAAKIEIRAKSIASEQHMARNEDSIFQVPQKGAFGVFDGMGGHAAGDVASRIARYNVEKSLKELPDGLSLEQTQRSLSTILKEAHEKISQQAKIDPQLKRMGTTASVVKIWEGPQGERKAVIGNVGDSRVYIRHANGSLEQVTLDDNATREMMARQTVSLAEARALQSKLSNVTDLSTLTQRERELYEDRNTITQALGHNASPRIHVVDVRVGDKLIVTSDGIHDNLTDTEISKVLAQSPDNQKAVENLTEAARRRSRDTNHPRFKPDDMSAVIAELSTTSHKAEPPKPSVQPQLKETGRLVVGDVVKVQRSSGAIEEGWRIEGFNPKTGDVITRKKEGGQTLEKEISQQELKALNPPKQETGIGGATDFIQLFNTIDSMGKIQGSQQTFEPAQLKQLINGVRSRKEPIDSITRAGGLRDKVAELIEADKIRANLKTPELNNSAQGLAKQEVSKSYQNLDNYLMGEFGIGQKDIQLLPEFATPTKNERVEERQQRIKQNVIDLLGRKGALASHRENVDFYKREFNLTAYSAPELYLECPGGATFLDEKTGDIKVYLSPGLQFFKPDYQLLVVLEEAIHWSQIKQNPHNRIVWKDEVETKDRLLNMAKFLDLDNQRIKYLKEVREHAVSQLQNAQPQTPIE